MDVLQLTASQGLEAATTEIREIGILAAPEEACGLVFFHETKSVVMRLQNKAEDRYRDVLMDKDDILEAVIEQFGTEWTPEGIHDKLLFWHTHPGGHEGPSEVDISQRESMPQWRMGVMTIPSGKWEEY